MVEAGPGNAVLAAKGGSARVWQRETGPARPIPACDDPKDPTLVQALREPGASDYAAIFRAHDSELLN